MIVCLIILDFNLSPCSECCVLTFSDSPASEFYMPTFRNTLFHLYLIVVCIIMLSVAPDFIALRIIMTTERLAIENLERNGHGLICRAILTFA